MKDKIIIAIDAMGGENAPSKNIEGIKLFINKNKDLKDYFFNIYGDESLIKNELNKFKIDLTNIKIFDTPSVVSDEETPLTAIKKSKNSSMWKSINSQIEDNSHITLSAGNTGVLFVISKMLLKTIEGVSKPALAGIWPTKKGVSVVLDLGANIECDENNLVDFSEMGSALYKSLYQKDIPKVGLLNIGSEEIKGTESIKKAFSKLKDISKYGDFQFNGSSGLGEVSSKLIWNPTCEFLGSDFGPKGYNLTFKVTDNNCPYYGESTKRIKFLLEKPMVDWTTFIPPNAFSPNGDGINDVFKLTNLNEPSQNLPIDGCDDNFESIMFVDRTGVEVYKSNDKYFEWDGDNRSPGVYFYYIKYTKSDYKGSVTIVY